MFLTTMTGQSTTVRLETTPTSSVTCLTPCPTPSTISTSTNYDWISGHQDTSVLNSSLYTMGLNANNYLVSLVMTDPADPNVSVYS